MVACFIFFPQTVHCWVLNAFLVCLPCLECYVRLCGLVFPACLGTGLGGCDFICNFCGGVIWGLGSMLRGGVSKYFELESVWSNDWKLGEGQSKKR